MNHFGKCILLFIASLGLVSARVSVWADEPIAASPTNGSLQPDQFNTGTPVMTFLDMYTQQPWGRYIVSETVTVPRYEYKEVKEAVYVPVWTTEPRTTTMTQYEPIYSYQPQVRTANTLNPFAAPQQTLEYVPVVQYQPRNVQQTQMVTFPKYEQREITRMIPVLVNAREQRARYVDRPLNTPTTVATPGGQANSLAANNLYQQTAMVAQANRNTSRLPTHPIDYPFYFGYNAYANSAARNNAVYTLPPAYYPNNNPSSVAYQNSTILGAYGNNYSATSSNVAAMSTSVPSNPSMQQPAVGYPTQQPAPNAGVYPIAYGNPMYANNGYANAGVVYPNSVAPATNSRPLIDLSRWTASTGSLFQGGFFNSNRNMAGMNYPPASSPVYAGATYASGTPYPPSASATPYLAQNNFGVSSNQPNYWSPVQNNGVTFRPVSAPYQTPFLQSVGPADPNRLRDPAQMGMPATVLR